MKKEKKIRTYQRRTKSGKMVTVKAHTAKYDAAEKAKELAKKKGAGDELEERKKKKTPQLELPFDENSDKDVLNEVKEVEKKETKKSTKADTPKKEAKTKTTTKTKATDSKTSEPAFTAAEFKEWYQGTGSAADKKVAKALRAQLGRSGYKKLEDEAIDNYSARGHLSMFKRVSTPTTETSTKTSSKMKESAKAKTPKASSETPVGLKAVDTKLARKVMRAEDFDSLKETKEYLAGMSRKSYDSYVKAYAKREMPKSPAAIEREAERRLSKLADSHLSALKKSLSKEQISRLKEVGLTPTTFAEKFGGSYADGKFTRTKRVQKGTRFEHKPVTKSFDAWVDLYEKTGGFELGEPIRKVSKKMSSKTKKSYTTAKRMKPSEVADMTTKRDWIYEG